jgi:O-antigen/teichoic acid export membrane protein
MIAGLLFGLNAALNLALTLALARAMTPEGFGALATWTAAAVFLVTGLFDWARFSAIRFYTPRARGEEPAVRATLDAAFSAMLPALALAVAGLLAGGVLPGLNGTAAAALAVLVAGNAACEYLTALARNLDATRVYARVIGLRQGLALGATVPVAALTGDAAITVAVLAASVWPAAIYGFFALRDREARLRLADRRRAGQFLAYGVPLIAAEAVFQGLGLLNRAWLAAGAGLATAGAYALAFDLAFKVAAVVASMGEASLLPRLVVRHEAGDREGDLVRRNVAAMLLLVVPAALGFWTLAEPFAALLLQPALRPGFGAVMGLAVLCAGLYVLQSYVLRPAFQLGLRTAPLFAAAAAAFAVDAAGLWLLASRDAQGAALAHALGLAAGAALLLAWGVVGLRLRWPWADTLKVAAAAAAMAAAGRGVIALQAGPLPTLVAGAAAMGTAYAAAALALDAAGLRRFLAGRWAARRAVPTAHEPIAPR